MQISCRTGQDLRILLFLLRFIQSSRSQSLSVLQRARLERRGVLELPRLEHHGVLEPCLMHLTTMILPREKVKRTGRKGPVGHHLLQLRTCKWFMKPQGGFLVLKTQGSEAQELPGSLPAHSLPALPTGWPGIHRIPQPGREPPSL